jgi:Outer membrane protein beta-barrel domain
MPKLTQSPGRCTPLPRHPKLLKFMKQKFIALILITIPLFSYTSNAQKGTASMSVGPSIGFPLNFSSGYKIGFGGGLRAYYGLTRQGSVMANVNFISFPSKFSRGSVNLTSLKLGYKTLFNAKNLFLYGDAGAVVKSGDATQSGADFGFGGGIGYSIPTGKNGFIDISPSANFVIQKVVNRMWLDLHFAYRFNFTQK